MPAIASPYFLYHSHPPASIQDIVHLDQVLSNNALLIVLPRFAACNPNVVPKEFAFSWRLDLSWVLKNRNQTPFTFPSFIFFVPTPEGQPSLILPLYFVRLPLSEFQTHQLSFCLQLSFCHIQPHHRAFVLCLGCFYLTILPNYVLPVLLVPYTERPWMTSPDRSDIPTFILLCT